MHPRPHLPTHPRTRPPARPTPPDLKIACSAHAPRPQVDFVIYKLGKRLGSPHWLTALKALMVFHRLMRECDPSFMEQVRGQWGLVGALAGGLGAWWRRRSGCSG
jgi:hypothetical protein